MSSARNQVQELLAFQGHAPGEHIQVSSTSLGPQHFVAKVVLSLPGLPSLKAEGPPSKGKKLTEQAAFQRLLELLLEKTGDWGLDWDQTVQDAQAGDALIKLAAYLSPALGSAEASATWLQTFESDGHLAATFDRLQQAGEPSLAGWGPRLSQKRKATLVEALVWRRFGPTVLGEQAPKGMAQVLALLGQR